MSDEAVKQTNHGASNQLIIVIIVTIALAVATGLVVRHNDTTANNHAMMTAEAMQKTEVKKAATAAAMKQAETDKMAAHDAMMHDTSTTTPAVITAQ